MTVLFFLATVCCFGQEVYDPQLVILSPNVVVYDKDFEDEISQANLEIQYHISQSENEKVAKKLDKNLQIIAESEIEYRKSLDFVKNTSLISHSYLIYRFYEYLPNLLVILKDMKSNGNILELMKISDEQHLQYVLNFPHIKFLKIAGTKHSKITVQLYDRVSNSLLLNKEYFADNHNQGFEFTCSDGSLTCTINNALSQALPEVIGIIAERSPTLLRRKELAQKRHSILINEFYSQPFDKSFCEQILPSSDSSINLASIYQCLIDSSRSKFVAFFLESSKVHDFKELNSHKDKDVKIMSSKDIKAPEFLDDIPQIYTYIIKGVKYQGKWYYEKSNATYFEANDTTEGKKKYFNSLQQWGFFKENSIEFNPDFWESTLFPKIKDITKDPYWEENGKDIWRAKEEENRDYIGIYEMVADKLKEEKEQERELFNSSISNIYFSPFYESCKMNRTFDITDYMLLDDKFILIYPKNKEVILNPIQIVTNSGETKIRYFLLSVNTGDIYEWTYFDQHPVTIDNNIPIYHYGSTVMAHLNKLTAWNFSFKSLNDNNFWDNYIFIKTDSRYKYLTRLK